MVLEARICSMKVGRLVEELKNLAWEVLCEPLSVEKCSEETVVRKHWYKSMWLYRFQCCPAENLASSLQIPCASHI